MKLRKNVTTLSMLTILSMQSFNAFSEEQRRTYPEIYPFVPFESQYIEEQVKKISENDNYIKNIYDMHMMKLFNGKTHIKSENGRKENVQPWMSTYWPLNRGLIADPKSTINPWNPLNTRVAVDWKYNYNQFLKRKSKVHEKIHDKDRKGNWLFDSEELSKLAPSEKYDLLLGDNSFNLTNRLWVYMEKWGSKKENGFLASFDVVGGKALELAEKMVADGQYEDIAQALPKAIKLRGGLAEHYAEELVKEGKYNSVMEALPEATNMAVSDAKNYVPKKKNSMMALWEGICHGWATAAGIVPRPKKSVDFRLADGRKLTFFPDDLKGLASLLWANSLIQDGKFEPVDNNGKNLTNEQGEKAVVGGIIMQGLRCNDKSPKTDEWGRYYDAAPDAFSKKMEPRCVGVHPSIWHMGLVNLIGDQGRSFIVERKIKAAVDNHPLTGYKMEFFNPYTGDYGSLADSVSPVTTDDQFYNFRNPEAKLIVGVKTTMQYLQWKAPKMERYDSESMDEIKEVDMLYDLELDNEGNIIGGQWRVKETGKGFLNIGASHTQPDFFWAVTKHWRTAGEIKGVSKPYFEPIAGLSAWDSKRGKLPGSDWLDAAKLAHSFEYQETHAMGWNKKCEAVNKKRRKAPVVEVPCEFKTNRPQPLINVVNELIKLSRE
jgi:hypothetical protein